VSVEFDCELEFHYKMPDKSICKHVSPCKKDGTTVQNTQCGGAESVEVYLGNHDQPDKEDCEIGLHHIGFDCNPPYQPPSQPSPPPVESQPASTTSEVVESTTQQASSTTSDIVETTSAVVESTSEAPQTTTQPPVETPFTTHGIYTNSSSTAVYSAPPPPEESSSVVLTTESPATSTDIPGYSAPPPEQSSTEIPGYSAPPPEQSSTEIPGYSAPPPEQSSTDIPGYSAPPPETSAVPSSTGAIPTSEAVPVPSSPATPEGPGYTPPEVLPKCMDTWIEVNTKCKDNTDSNCYCSNPDFTKNVIDCVSAWSTDAQIKEALQYLIGICASYVPTNPGIITNCPSDINNPPTPPTAGVTTGTAPIETTAAAVIPPAPTGPVTTITYMTTATVPCSTGGSTVTTISTEVTVPQVIFHTQTPGPEVPGATPSAPVELVPGTAPPPVPAQTTGAPYPIPSGLTTATLPFASGTGTAGNGTAPPEFTGAASSMNTGLKPAGVIVGAVLAFFAL
jgi:hypothetical protein